jgi:competence protein ComEA
MHLVFAIFLLISMESQNGAKPRLEGVLNLNTASPEEFGLLPGIGPSRIRNILAYRQAHPFRTVEELARIKGIGRKSVRKLRMHLAVDGPTTIQKVLRPPTTTPPPAPPAPTKPAVQARGRGRPLPPARRTKPGHVRPSREYLRGVGNHCLPPP